jgi:hypothetical protein
MHTAEPLIPEATPFEIEIATEELKRYESLGFDLFPSELIQAGCNTLRSETHKLINYIWNKK